MPNCEMKDSTAHFLFVIANAELAGLVRFEVRDDERLIVLTEKGCEWNIARGLNGKMDGDTPRAVMEDAMMAFLAFFSREIGMPLLADDVLYHSVEMAEARIAAARVAVGATRGV